MAFDGERYHREVVEPLRVHADRPHDLPAHLPRDAHVRYQHPGDLASGQLGEHLDAVLAGWRERRDERNRSSAVYAALLEGHRELEADPAVDLRSPLWWREPAGLLLGPHREAARVHADGEGRGDAVDDAGVGPDPGTVAEPQRVAAPRDEPDAYVPPTPRAEGEGYGPRVGEIDGLQARRTAVGVELSWLWPAWSRSALVEWRHRGREYAERVDLVTYERSGFWHTARVSTHGEEDTVFGVTLVEPEGRGGWRSPAKVVVPPPVPEISFSVRRRRRWRRVVTVDLTTAGPVPPVYVFIGFCTKGHLPSSPDECDVLERVEVAEGGRRVDLALPGRVRGRVWAFLADPHERAAQLRPPDTRTVEVGRW